MGTWKLHQLYMQKMGIHEAFTYVAPGGTPRLNFSKPGVHLASLKQSEDIWLLDFFDKGRCLFFVIFGPQKKKNHRVVLIKNITRVILQGPLGSRIFWGATNDPHGSCNNKKARMLLFWDSILCTKTLVIWDSEGS